MCGVLGFGPHVSVMTRKTLASCIATQCVKTFTQLRENFKTCRYVCSPANIWSCHGYSYLGKTIQWITDDLSRKSVVLAYRRFKGTYSCDKIAELITHIFADYELDTDKTVSVVTNNGSNFVKAFKG